ncbi:MAG: FG-GAP repeat domain-containing protein [Phycisphaerales bacterium]
MPIRFPFVSLPSVDLSAGLILCAFAGLSCGDAIGGEPEEVIQSQYTSALGSGGLAFTQELHDGEGLLPLPKIHAARDINGDGILDLIFAFDDDFPKAYGSALGFVRDDGSIGFEVQESFEATSQFDAIDAADLDGDGRAEFIFRFVGLGSLVIVTFEDGEKVEIRGENLFGEDYNSGASTFLDARSMVHTGDLDGDGIADVVLNTTQSRVVVRWSSRPEGTEYGVYPVPFLGSQCALYPVADYNGDSKNDVLVLDVASERFILLEGIDMDSVGLPRVVDVPVSGFVEQNYRPLFGQFDNDPAIDVVLRDGASGESFAVLNFTEGMDQTFSLGVDAALEPVEIVGDLDGSGFDDVLFVGVDPLSTGSVDVEDQFVLLDPSADGSTLISAELGNIEREESELNGDSPLSRSSIAMNLDSDEDMELLWTGGSYSYFVQDPDGLVGAGNRWSVFRVSDPRQGDQPGLDIGAVQIEAQRSPTHSIAVDVDDDGVDELLVVGTGSRAKLVDFVDGTSVNVPGMNNSTMVALADIQGDGDPEIVVGRAVDSVLVYTISSDGTIGGRVAYPNPNDEEYESIVVADLNLDGRDDIAGYDPVSREIHIFQGMMDGTIELETILTGIAPSTENKIETADMNGDGLSDLITGSDDGFVVYENTGDLTFVDAGLWIPSLFSPVWIVINDVDLDGHLDLVTANGTDPLVVYFLDGEGGVERVSLDAISDHQILEVLAEDVNGDGLVDLIGTVFNGTQSVERVFNKQVIWIQVSPRVFEPGVILPGPDSSALAAGNFDGDGVRDLAISSGIDDSVRVHWGVPAACAADLNGDGDLNFLDISMLLSDQPDFNGDGGFNFLDISAYLAAFGAGCP